MSHTILNANEELEAEKRAHAATMTELMTEGLRCETHIAQRKQLVAQIQLLTKFLAFALRAADYDWEDGALLITEREMDDAAGVEAKFEPGSQLWRVRVKRPADPSVIQ